MQLQLPPGTLMGTAQAAGTVPAGLGDILPFTLAGAVPTATGAGWAMQLPPVYSVSALGTLATGTTTLNWAAYNYFTLTAYGGAFTLAFSNVSVGQQIQLFVTGAGSAAATWPSGITWIGLTSAPAASSSAPVLTANTVLITLTCTAANTFVGSYITS